MRYNLLPSGFVLLISTFGLIMSCSNQQSDKSEEMSGLKSYHEAFELVQTVYNQVGGTDILMRSGGIYLEGEGTYDLSTRMQGKKPNVREPYPIKESLGVDMQSGKVAYESDTFVNPDAREWIRYIYDGQNRMLFLSLYGGFAFWDSEPGLNEQKKRYSNMVPHLLLREALDNRSSLKYLGKDDSNQDIVSYQNNSYGTVILYIDSEVNLLKGAEYLKDMPLAGDTSIKFTFKSYSNFKDLGQYPDGYTVTLNDKPLKDIDYHVVRPVNSNAPVFTVPDSINVPEMPEPPKQGVPPVPVEEAPAREPVQLAEGVFVYPNIRSGFHPLVVEFGDYLMVVDAPAGWLEMQQLPAMQWVDGVTSSSTGRKFLNAIKQKFPDKPVKYVALTHFHSDHAGGIRPFIAEGATVLASPTTAPVIQQAVKNRFTLAPDELSQIDVEPVIEIVNGELAIEDSTMKVRLIDVGSNPHAEGMLVAYLPELKILYQSDLFEPIPMRVFPSRERIPVMKWFVDWLDNSGLDFEKVYAIHAGLRVTDEHLDYIRNMD